MLRYHKKVYFKFEDTKRLETFTGLLNVKQWAFSSHCLDNLKYRDVDVEAILLFIKNLKLKYEDIFEFYTDDKGELLKLCYRIKFNKTIDIILVISAEKKIITIYENSANDLHYTLNESLYQKNGE